MSDNMWCFLFVFVFVVFDYVTGVLKAVMAGALSSGVMRSGLMHKFAYLLVLTLAELIELCGAHFDLGYSLPVVSLCGGFIILIEITSILENLVKINPALKNSKILQLLTPKSDSGKDDING